MSILQFKATIAPKSEQEKAVKNIITDESYFEPDYDGDIEILEIEYNISLKKLTEDFANILPPTHSWSEEILFFGDEENNCLSICFNEDTKKVTHVGMYIYCEKLNNKFVKNICDFLVSLDWIIVYTRTQEVFKPA